MTFSVPGEPPTCTSPKKLCTFGTALPQEKLPPRPTRTTFVSGGPTRVPTSMLPPESCSVAEPSSSVDLAQTCPPPLTSSVAVEDTIRISLAVRLLGPFTRILPLELVPGGPVRRTIPGAVTDPPDCTS